MKKQTLNRYTYLPILFDLLDQKRLTMLDPKKWDDKNDSYYLELYKKTLKLKSLLALCFSESGETYEMWKVFSGGTSGVCIEFDKELLISYFNKDERIICGSIEYLTRRNMRNKDIQDFEKLPFMKRRAFKNEKEFRFILKEIDRKIPGVFVPIGIDCISRITFNPWIPNDVYESNKAIIRRIDGCKNISIRRTSVIDNEEWKTTGERIANSYGDAHALKKVSNHNRTD